MHCVWQFENVGICLFCQESGRKEKIYPEMTTLWFSLLNFTMNFGILNQILSATNFQKIYSHLFLQQQHVKSCYCAPRQYQSISFQQIQTTQQHRFCHVRNNNINYLICGLVITESSKLFDHLWSQCNCWYTSASVASLTLLFTNFIGNQCLR